MPSIIAGRKPVIEALKAGTPVERIVLLAGVQGRVIAEIEELAELRRVPVSVADKHEFRQLASDVTTQGVLAVAPTREFAGMEDILEEAQRRRQPGLVLILDEIEDPHNLGALIRTAECAGAHGVVIPRHHAATVTSTVVKASAGATEHVLIAEVTNIARTIKQLKDEGYWIVGLDGNGDRMHTEVDYTLPIALVVGNEGRGIRRLVGEQCDYRVRIPLLGKVESLNASVAGGVVLYEVLRRRVEAGLVPLPSPRA